MAVSKPCVGKWLETGEHEQYQASVEVDHIDDFGKSGLDVVDLGEFVDDDCCEYDEIGADAREAAYDVWKESVADSVAATYRSCMLVPLL